MLEKVNASLSKHGLASLVSAKDMKEVTIAKYLIDADYSQAKFSKKSFAVS